MRQTLSTWRGERLRLPPLRKKFFANSPVFPTLFFLKKNDVTRKITGVSWAECVASRPKAKGKRGNTSPEHEARGKKELTYFTTHFSFLLALRDRIVSCALHGFIVRFCKRLFCRMAKTVGINKLVTIIREKDSNTILTFASTKLKQLWLR